MFSRENDIFQFGVLLFIVENFNWSQHCLDISYHSLILIYNGY